MEFTTEQIAEMGARVREIKREKGSRGVMEFAQPLVKELAPVVVAKYPDVARSDPKQIGAFCKSAVIAFLLTVAKY